MTNISQHSLNWSFQTTIWLDSLAFWLALGTGFKKKKGAT